LAECWRNSHVRIFAKGIEPELPARSALFCRGIGPTRSSFQVTGWHLRWATSAAPFVGVWAS
jgi:hypothetical protein